MQRRAGGVPWPHSPPAPGAAGMLGRAGAAVPWHGYLCQGCTCHGGPWLHSHLAFFAFVVNNQHGSVEAEPHPDRPGNRLRRWGG